MAPLPELSPRQYEKKRKLYARSHPKVRPAHDRFYLTFSSRATSCRECGHRTEAGSEYLYRGLGHLVLCQRCGRRFKVRYELSNAVKQRRGDSR